MTSRSTWIAFAWGWVFFMPNRVLRDWTTSDNIDRLSQGAEIFFTRLIMKADDHGCFHGNYKLLNAALFPLKDYTKEDVGKWRLECEKANIIEVYSVDSKPYIRIIDFNQRLRLMKSKFPQPNDGQMTDNGRPETKRNEEESETETKGVSFDEKFKEAFDDITCERFKLTFKNLDLGRELQEFRTKCDNDPKDYHQLDLAGLRNGFQYQLKNAKNGKSTPQSKADANLDALKARHNELYNQGG